MSKATAILVGADPELFVSRNGKPWSAIGLIGGTKCEPRVIDRGGLQEDNVLAEFNITPASTEDEFVGNILDVVQVLKAVLPHGMDILPIASHEYTHEEIDSFGPAAKMFGCDPDYDAYRICVNEPPAAHTLLRTAGGHIHVGYDNPDNAMSADIVLAMDVMLGVPSVLIDGDTRRRQMYGKAGCFRFKEYGLEYRTLSNFWIMSEERIRWAFRQTQQAVAVAQSGNVEHNSTLGIPHQEIMDCINNSDKHLARRICDELGIQLVK